MAIMFIITTKRLNDNLNNKIEVWNMKYENKEFENTVIAYKCKTCGRLGYYDMNKDKIHIPLSS